MDSSFLGREVPLLPQATSIFPVSHGRVTNSSGKPERSRSGTAHPLIKSRRAARRFPEGGVPVDDGSVRWTVASLDVRPLVASLGSRMVVTAMSVYREKDVDQEWTMLW